MSTETMDLHEVALLCRAEPETIAQYARIGLLPGTKMGKGWVFLHDDVITFLRQRIAEETQLRRTRTGSGELKKPEAIQVASAPKRRRTVLPDLPSIPTSRHSP